MTVDDRKRCARQQLWRDNYRVYGACKMWKASNPIYGQGMTVSALDAVALRDFCVAAAPTCCDGTSAQQRNRLVWRG
jgi:hypothetical protein